MDFMHEYAKKQKLLEINPRSPLIEGLLRRVGQLPGEGEERDLEAEAELEEVAHCDTLCIMLEHTTNSSLIDTVWHCITDEPY